jgi:hypothetical protein
VRLGDAVRQIESLDQDLTIYAQEPWNADSEIEFAPCDQRVMADMNSRGLTYFLEIFVAKEILENWVAERPRSDAERFAFVVYYARNDAFPEE